MRSARRRQRIEKKERSTKTVAIMFKVLLPLAIIFLLLAVFKLGTKYWDGSDKFAVAYQTSDGNAAVTVFDPKANEVTTLIIPGDTEVNVARSYGTLRIKNVWQLGKNEKIGGSLLAETIAQNFLFPVYLWSDSVAEKLGSGNLSGIVKFVFLPGLTNIPFGDRASAGLFALKVNEQGRTTVELGKSQFLTKQKLNDGQSGYVLSGPISERLSIFFSDNEIAGKTLMVNIKDATGKSGVAEKVGQLVEVMGGKVISIDKKPLEGRDCTVTGGDVKIVRKTANLFSCETKKAGKVGELEIDLGQAFAKRF